MTARLSYQFQISCICIVIVPCVISIKSSSNSSSSSSSVSDSLEAGSNAPCKPLSQHFSIVDGNTVSHAVSAKLKTLNTVSFFGHSVMNTSSSINFFSVVHFEGPYNALIQRLDLGSRTLWQIAQLYFTITAYQSFCRRMGRTVLKQQKCFRFHVFLP